MEKNLPGAAWHYRITGCLLWLLLAVTANKAAAQSADIKLLRSVYNNRPAALRQPVNITEQTVYPLSVALPAGLFAYGLLQKDSAATMQAVQVAGGLVMAAGAAYLLKKIVNRQRPATAYPYIIPYEQDNSYSFPSGHTSVAFATATSVFLQYRRWYIAAPAFAWAGFAAYGRLYQGMHYPTDVAAGAFIGAGAACISYYGQRWITAKRQKRREAKQL